MTSSEEEFRIHLVNDLTGSGETEIPTAETILSAIGKNRDAILDLEGADSLGIEMADVVVDAHNQFVRQGGNGLHLKNIPIEMSERIRDAMAAGKTLDPEKEHAPVIRLVGDLGGVLNHPDIPNEDQMLARLGDSKIAVVDLGRVTRIGHRILTHLLHLDIAIRRNRGRGICLRNVPPTIYKQIQDRPDGLIYRFFEVKQQEPGGK